MGLLSHNDNRSADYQALGGSGYVGENIYGSSGNATARRRDDAVDERSVGLRLRQRRHRQRRPLHADRLAGQRANRLRDRRLPGAHVPQYGHLRLCPRRKHLRSDARTDADAAPTARYWSTQPDGRILCTLCPRYCRVADGQAGFCFIRQNRGGKLVQLGYGRSTGFAIDPIEKKPLNHFYPGTPVLSFGTAGCNLGCKFCQNWDISKAKLDEQGLRRNTPDEVVDLAVAQGAPSIAYTYNDPVIWAEYVIDIARAARRRGVKNVLVTAGYVTDEARPELYADADAANVDLKAFSEDFYRKTTASHLEPVLETLKWIRHKSDTWLEVTTLLIPGHNDSDDELARLAAWFAANLGPDVPLHFTAFHPDFKMTDLPADAARDAAPRPRHRARRRSALRLRRQRARRGRTDDVLRALRAAADRARLVRDHALRPEGRRLRALRASPPRPLRRRAGRAPLRLPPPARERLTATPSPARRARQAAPAASASTCCSASRCGSGSRSTACARSWCCSPPMRRAAGSDGRRRRRAA